LKEIRVQQQKDDKKTEQCKNILQGDPVDFHQFDKRVDQGTDQYS